MVNARPTAPATVPGPRGLPGLGMLPAFAWDPLAFLTRMARQHGDLVHFRVVDHDILFVAHPDLADEVLRKHAAVLHKDAIYALLEPAVGKGLVTSEGEQWRRNRKLAAPSFTARHVEVYADAMVRIASRFADGLVPGAALDLHAAMMDLSRDIVLETLFGADVQAEVEGVVQIVSGAIETMMDAFVFESNGLGRILPMAVDFPVRRRHRRAIADLDRVTYALIAARRRLGLGDDLLSRLIAARDDAGRGFTEQELRDEVVTAFVAGHETTALALTYTHSLLAQHPEVRARLWEEVAEVLGGAPATAASARVLPYTTAVIREAMRVLPPVWAIGREATAPFEIAGVRVPIGCQVLMSPWVMHRDPRWFADPEVFRPERWLDPSALHPAAERAWLPFGGGPRVCIGKHFAMLEAVLVLATLAQRRWLRPTRGLPALQPSITLRPRGPVPAVVEAA